MSINNSCICNEGYYDNGINSTCERIFCDENCFSCMNQSLFCTNCK